MKIENVTEVNIIEEVMDEDKSPKDRCVESAMDTIHEVININSKYLIIRINYIDLTDNLRN